MADELSEDDIVDPNIAQATKFLPWLAPLCGAVMIALLAMVAVHMG